MMNAWIRLKFFLVFFLASSFAGAAVVQYDEATDGDLTADRFSPLPILSFDIGNNTVRGSTGAESINFTADIDNFAFTIPSGAQLLSIQVILNDVTGNLIETAWRLQGGSATPTQSSLIEELVVPSPGTSSFASLPVGAGLYNMEGGYFMYSGDVVVSNYQFTFVVQPLVTVVPEPTTLALFCLPLLLIVFGIRSNNC